MSTFDISMTIFTRPLLPQWLNMPAPVMTVLRNLPWPDHIPLRGGGDIPLRETFP